MIRARFIHTLAAIAATLATLACGSLFTPPRESQVFPPILGRPDGYGDAVQAASWNRQTPAADPYYRLVDKQFGTGFRAALKTCRWDINETRGATFLYRLDAFGNAVESMVYPQSDFSDCMQPVVNAYRFPPPPQENYWVGIFIAGCSQSGARGLCVEYY